MTAFSFYCFFGVVLLVLFFLKTQVHTFLFIFCISLCVFLYYFIKCEENFYSNNWEVTKIESNEKI